MKDTIKISTIGKMTRAQEKFVVRELPNRGMGVVSIREINPGDMIAAENPLFIVPWWVRHSAYPR